MRRAARAGFMPNIQFPTGMRVERRQATLTTAL
jgi:hypothetical protein